MGKKSENPQFIECTVCSRRVEIPSTAEMIAELWEIENFVCSTCEAGNSDKALNGVNWTRGAEA